MHLEWHNCAGALYKRRCGAVRCGAGRGGAVASKSQSDLNLIWL